MGSFGKLCFFVIDAALRIEAMDKAERMRKPQADMHLDRQQQRLAQVEIRHWGEDATRTCPFCPCQIESECQLGASSLSATLPQTRSPEESVGLGNNSRLLLPSRANFSDGLLQLAGKIGGYVFVASSGCLAFLSTRLTRFSWHPCPCCLPPFSFRVEGGQLQEFDNCTSNCLCRLPAACNPRDNRCTPEHRRPHTF